MSIEKITHRYHIKKLKHLINQSNMFRMNINTLFYENVFFIDETLKVKILPTTIYLCKNKSFILIFNIKYKLYIINKYVTFILSFITLL